MERTTHRYIQNRQIQPHWKCSALGNSTLRNRATKQLHTGLVCPATLAYRYLHSVTHSAQIIVLKEHGYRVHGMISH